MSGVSLKKNVTHLITTVKVFLTDPYLAEKHSMIRSAGFWMALIPIFSRTPGGSKELYP
jgi:hypothetical protein